MSRFEMDFYRVESEPDRFDLNVCRTCLVPSASVPLFSEIDEDIGVMLVAIAGVALEADDGLPEAVCESCAGSLRTAYAFRLRAQQSDRTLRSSRLVDACPEQFLTTADKILLDEEKITITYPDTVQIKQEKETTCQGDVQIKQETATYYDELQIKQEGSTVYQDDVHVSEEEAETIMFQNEIKNESKELEHKGVTPKNEISMKQIKQTPSIPKKGKVYLLKKMEPTTVLKDEYKCEIKEEGVKCEEVFSTKYKLKRHELKHRRAGKFVCSRCGRGFPFDCHRRLHLKRCTKYGFYCDVCSKGFVKRKSLTSHIRLHHTGVRPFSCKECPKTFTMKHNMVAHVKQIHRGEKRRSERLKSSQSPKKLRPVKTVDILQILECNDTDCKKYFNKNKYVIQ